MNSRAQPCSYTVELTDAARADLAAIADNRTYQAITRRLLELMTEPNQRGKSLTGDLKGYRSVRAAGQRYRIIYQVRGHAHLVTVVVIAIRREGDKRDAYRVARRRLRKG